MKLEQYRTTWGTIDIAYGALAKAPYKEFDELIPALAELGYDGIEMPFRQAMFVGLEKVKSLLEKHNMRLTVLVFSDNVCCSGPDWGGPYEGFTAPTTDAELKEALVDVPVGDEVTPSQVKVVDTHVKVFKEQVEGAYKAFGDRKNGGLLTLCVAQSMQDSFTHGMAAKYFREVLKWEEENGYTVAHETHRKRFLYSPWTTRDFFTKYPDIHAKIKMCADLSHWINVAETDTNDPVFNQAIDFIIPNIIHMHCRVGYEHGPQVSDPRAPEWIAYMEGHERWWDKIWKAMKASGKFEYATMILEHGPPPYQPCAPGTKEPLALIWDVNHWIGLRMQKRFGDLFGAGETSKLIVSETQGYEPETEPQPSALTPHPSTLTPHPSPAVRTAAPHFFFLRLHAFMAMAVGWARL